MANAKFQDIDLVTLSETGTFVGVRDNGDGTFTDIRVSASEMVRYITESSRKIITALDANIGAGGTTLTDPFFLIPISELITNSQAYIKDVDFTQNTSTGTVTGLNMTFYDTQKLIARR